jgi:hypothetical protein
MRRLSVYLVLGAVLLVCFARGQGTSASHRMASAGDGPGILQATPNQTLDTPEPKTDTPTPTPGLAIVGDRVWFDRDGDGIQDDGEESVAGVVVRLYSASGTLLGTTTTAANGYYYFDGLSAGDYYIEFQLPDGYVFALPNQGSQFQLDSDADRETGRTEVFPVRLGDYQTWWDAGLWRTPRFEGFKFWDQDDDGTWDGGEPMVGGVPIIVRNESGEIVLQTTTVDDPGTPEHGHWSASLAIDPGIYTVEEVVPEGWRRTVPWDNNGIYRIQTYADGTYEFLTPRPEGVEGLSFGNYKLAPCRLCPEWVLIQSDRNNKNVDIWRTRFDGTEPFRLTVDLAQDIQPMWDYTGTQIAFASVRDGDWEIYRMDADGNGETNVTKWPLADDQVSPSQDLAPHWNCSEIVFQTDRHGDWEIYRTDPGGVNQVRLTYDPATDLAPHWSPYEDWIAFESDRDGNWEIYRMDPNGDNLERLTFHEADDRNVTWSTDQKWIFFESDRADEPGENVDIYKMNLETRQVIRLTDDPSYDTDPDAMPYCEWVFFESNRDRNIDVWRMRDDGTQERNIILGDTDIDYWADHLDHDPGPWVDAFLPLAFR